MIIDDCPPSSACCSVSSSVLYEPQSTQDTVDCRVNEAEIHSFYSSTVCSPSSSRHLKSCVPNTESIRDFAKGVGMPLAIQDNVRDCCERCYLKVAQS